jgi:hypothetical protein
MYSAAYVEHLANGPFPGHIDPWAEAARYFHPIHGSMISALLDQTGKELLARGYFASRETSLQIAERIYPDVMVRDASQRLPTRDSWNYAAAAADVLAEPGILLTGETPELEAITIRHFESGDLVTVVEVISPGNKNNRSDIEAYIERRDTLIRREAVNFVEIDATRSHKRLLQDVLASTYAYHAAIYIPGDLPRILGVDYGQPLKRLALPLRNEVIGVEIQAAYDIAYQQVATAAHIDNDNGYIEDELPFPSLLTSDQRTDAVQVASQWKYRLELLRQEQS